MYNENSKKGNLITTSQISRRDFFGKAAKASIAGLAVAATGGLINPGIANAEKKRNIRIIV